MIIFLEYDTAGNVVHVCRDPQATVTPVTNRMTPASVDGPFGYPLDAPVAIDETTFDTIQAGAAVGKQYTYDPATGTVSEKP